MNKVIKNSSYFILLYLLLVPTLAFSQGSRYTGDYKKSDPIEHVGKKTIIIEGLEFTSAGNLRAAITLWNCDNVIIRNCKFKDINSKLAIYAENSSNILVTDCTFENVFSGFRALNGNGSIRFDYNDVTNIVGNLNGGKDKSQVVQLDKYNGAGSSISYNSIENLAGKSSPEDLINLFNSNGTSGSPIRIANNWIRGGGPSPSGGGIILGDHGGSYQIAENNILVNPGQYGISIAGGHNMTIRNNKIYGKRQPFNNIGLYAVNWTESISPSHTITIENNEINFTNAAGSLNNTWFDGSVGTIKGKDTNKYNKDLNESILPAVIVNRAGKTGVNQPEVNQPTTPASLITQVYSDRFDRIAIKYLVSPIPLARAEGYTASGELLISMTLPRYNQSFPISVPKGEYYIKVTYPESGKTETTKIIIK